MSLNSQADPFKDIRTCGSGTSTSSRKKKGREGAKMASRWTEGGALQRFKARRKVTKQGGNARCLEQVTLAICR